MDGSSQQPACSGCAELAAKLDRLLAKVDKLEKELAKCKDELAKAKKHSGNSSKPPSGDIVSPKKATAKSPKGRRKRGGQPGHPRHERSAFNPEQIDFTWIHYYEACPCCGGTLEDTDEPIKILQQVELLPVPLEISEHQRVAQQCTQCHKKHLAPWPEDLQRAGLVGPRLTALIAYLKSACHMSYLAIRRFLRDVVGVKISNGMVRKLIGKVTDGLRDPYEALFELLSKEGNLNVDETGHKNSGQRLWTWCFRASLFTVFKISPSRGSQVLIEVLGEEFNGVLGCDYFSAYRKYMKDFNVSVQFCIAHLIRDIKFLVEHPQRKNQDYGKHLLELFRELFGVIHRREKYPTERGFQNALAAIRNRIVHEALMLCPDTKEANNLNNRFVEHFESYFRFITTPGVEPTNNLAEQAIRFVAIHRRITQGTRGEWGQTWCERIWTVIATCEQQSRSVFDFLMETMESYIAGKPAPSLIPDSS